jgi:hypothetical protein
MLSVDKTFFRSDSCTHINTTLAQNGEGNFILSLWMNLMKFCVLFYGMKVFETILSSRRFLLFRALKRAFLFSVLCLEEFLENFQLKHQASKAVYGYFRA